MANKFFTAIKARFFNTPADTALDVGVNGDANPRISIDAGGRVSWGDGQSPVDTNLYRYSPNSLRTDDRFYAPSLLLGATELTSISVSLLSDEPDQVIDTSAAKTIKYLIHAQNENHSEVTEILAVNNNSILNYVEYGKISTSGINLSEYDVTLSSGNVQLSASPSSSNMIFNVLKIITT